MCQGLRAGHNVDRVNIEAGLEELARCEYDDPRTKMVIEYALKRHGMGEEDAAERGAIDEKFHGISFTCWRRVLAVAVSTPERKNKK